MEPQASVHDDDMPAEIDFAQGTRGKIVQPGTALNLPVYLDAEVQALPLGTRQSQGRRGRPARQRAVAQGHRADRDGTPRRRPSAVAATVLAPTRKTMTPSQSTASARLPGENGDVKLSRFGTS